MKTKCDTCENSIEVYDDIYGTYMVCRKGHWEHDDSEDGDYIDLWDNCKDYKEDDQ